ncbi:MAG: hypothetical protein HYX78_02490 [Armatimonadetes bacterium]|nr:hypothetical protein [Armatimonadota bacterium]
MFRILLSAALFLTLAAGSVTAGSVTVRSHSDAPCIKWGTQKLKSALASAGYKVSPKGKTTIEIVVDYDGEGFRFDGEGFEIPPHQQASKPDGYMLRASARNVSIIGFDAAGAMYGCLDLAKRIADTGRIPASLDISTSPAMSLRSTAIHLMKLGLYDYPITPEEFPFFYDKKMWIEFLDFLAENRFNAITFWNGHPFDYFVRLEKYPEAQDGMPPGQVEKNHDMLMWLGKEAEKRSIWLMFEFYNIHLSVYFAKAHNLPMHGISKPTPLLSAYTGYAIEKFVSEFPNIGLYICPGESLGMEYTDDWINNVIFAAVKRTGKTPPIVIRSWGIDLEHMKKLVGNYPRLYTERKFNVEMIASTDIDPENSDWAGITGDHVVNIHMMGNLEPFRWCPPTYIQKCVQNSIKAGGTGIHLYSRKPWRWPYGCDLVDKPETQWQRDWMWFEIWGRYVWSPNLDPAKEKEFWLARLKKWFGTAEAARHILKCYEAQADVLPAIQRLIWLGDSNHSIVAAGLMLDQIQSAKGIPFLPLPGQVRIPDWIESLKNGEQVSGTTPEQLLVTKLAEAEAAYKEARLGAKKATRNVTEARRIETDTRAVVLVARYYIHKLRAGMTKALFDAGIDTETNRTACIENLAASVEDYRKLTALTRSTYESISDVPAWHPVRWQDNNWENTGPCPYHWSDLLPIFEEELSKIKSAL